MNQAWAIAVPGDRATAANDESLEDAVADLPKSELERLLCLAVVEVMESRADAERDFERLVRRLDKQRGSYSNPP
jgi:hypothetical protein